MKTLILIAIAGFAAQLVDGGLGMGFGATSTTILVTLAALTPAAASAVVHTAEVGTTLVSGFSHWRFGNVDWKVVLKIGLPGAVGAFAGATVLSHISTEAAAPVMAIILAAIGLNLVVRFARGRVQRQINPKPHSAGFLGGLGLFGGFIDASGGGGWGPVTTSTLLSLGRSEPRRIVGTVNTAEFLVSLAATLGFVIGLWDDLIANLGAVLALLIGGALAAPIAAWLVSRLNPSLLGGVVGTLLIALNLPAVLDLFSVPDGWVWAINIAVIILGFALSIGGAVRAHRNAATQAPASTDITVAPAGAPAEQPAREQVRR